MAIRPELIGQFERPKSPGTLAATETWRSRGRSPRCGHRGLLLTTAHQQAAGALITLVSPRPRSCAGPLLLSKREHKAENGPLRRAESRIGRYGPS